jgi:hypothetical protein
MWIPKFHIEILCSYRSIFYFIQRRLKQKRRYINSKAGRALFWEDFTKGLKLLKYRKNLVKTLLYYGYVVWFLGFRIEVRHYDT